MIKELIINNQRMSYCKINRDNNNAWTISEWFTDKNHLHQGYGKQVLTSLLHEMYENFGRPSEVKYIWNGANEYVMDWLKRFDPVCMLPITAMKYSEIDKWEAHVYTLNTDKILRYMEQEIAS